VAVLQVSMWPTRVSMFEHLSEQVGHLRVLISTATEPGRPWVMVSGRIDVVIQRTLSLVSYWRHPLGFRDQHYVRFPLDSYSQLCRFGPDVTISLELGFRTLSAVLFRLAHRQTRLIVWVCMTEHQQKGYRPVRTRLRKALIRFADAVVANGSSAKRYMMGLGYPEKQIFIVPTVCDLGPFLSIPPRSPKPGVRRLGYVGRLVEGKGLLEFLARLDAFARRNHSIQLEFEVYGYGPLEDALGRLRGSPNLKVLYKGRLSLDGLPKAYASLDIFVFPTLSDEWGLVINEAMASGLAVLGSKYSQAVEDLVEDGETGWTFAPDNQGEVDRAIERALQVPEATLRLMGQAARRAVAAVAPARGADSMVDAIAHVLEQHNK
jgi:glycosyltransferase involved in cell wall biosynthesis